MKNKNIIILLAVAAGLYFVTKKKKKKGTVSVENFLPLQGNEAEIEKEEKYVYPGEMATLPQVQVSRELPQFPTTIQFLTNKILPVVKKQVVKKTAKKTQAKKTQAKKTRAQKLGELGALYI
jgi:hypothetical protein